MQKLYKINKIIENVTKSLKTINIHANLKKYIKFKLFIEIISNATKSINKIKYYEINRIQKNAIKFMKCIEIMLINIEMRCKC